MWLLAWLLQARNRPVCINIQENNALYIWLALRTGKMNQILRCDWLPERGRWSHLARLGLPALSRKKHFPKSHIINPLLTKLVRSRWLDIGLVRFGVFMELDSVSVHKHAEKELVQYPAILTSHLVNNPCVLANQSAMYIGYKVKSYNKI